MEETKKSRNDQGGNNKMVIKIGGGGGGVVGAVVLLGGALATAAFASAFVLGQKRRSSDKDRRPNSSPEIDEKSEKQHEHISQGAKEEVEMENDSTVMISAHSSDVEAISDDGFVIVKASSEIPLLAEKAEKDKVELTKEEVSEQSTNFEQVSIKDESAEREIEMQPREVDNGVEGDKIDDKNVNMEVNMKTKKEFTTFSNGNGGIYEEKSVNGCIVHPSPQTIPPVQFDANNEGEKEISAGDVEMVKHVENENTGEAFVQDPDSEAEEVHEDDAKRAREEEVEQEFIENGNGKAKMSKLVNGEVGLVHSCADGFNRKGDSSKWEALWPNVVPQRVKLVSYEVGGKVQEDVKEYEVEMGMPMDDHPSSTRSRMIVWTLSVLSSLSCSWFFDLSIAKLCLVVFLTVFLLEIYGYPLFNRRRLIGAKGESSYEPRQ